MVWNKENELQLGKLFPFFEKPEDRRLLGSDSTMISTEYPHSPVDVPFDQQADWDDLVPPAWFAPLLDDSEQEFDRVTYKREFDALSEVSDEQYKFTKSWNTHLSSALQLSARYRDDIEILYCKLWYDQFSKQRGADCGKPFPEEHLFDTHRNQEQYEIEDDLNACIECPENYWEFERCLSADSESTKDLEQTVVKCNVCGGDCDCNNRKILRRKSG